MLESRDKIAFWSREHGEMSVKKYDFYVYFLLFSFCSILLYVYLYVVRHQTSCAPPLSPLPSLFFSLFLVCL